MPIKSYEDFNEAVSRMTMSLGLALAQWQTVEHMLFMLYTKLCGSSDVNVTTIIYHSMSLEMKMKAVGALIAHWTPHDRSYIQDWDKISKAFFKQKRLRDKLAHWTIMSSPAPNEPGRYISYLCPPISDGMRVSKIVPDPSNSEAISAEELQRRSISDFQMVSGAMQRFMQNFPTPAPALFRKR